VLTLTTSITPTRPGSTPGPGLGRYPSHSSSRRAARPRPSRREARSANVGEVCKRHSDWGHVHDGRDGVALLLDPLGVERAIDLGPELLPEVKWQVVDVGPALEPPAAARADHVGLAPAVDNNHCSEAVAAREGHFCVLWPVLDEWAARQESEFSCADGLKSDGTLVVWRWDRECDHYLFDVVAGLKRGRSQAELGPRRFPGTLPAGASGAGPEHGLGRGPTTPGP
jgi:hypothetical protein